MIIVVNDRNVELSTKLGTAVAIEQKFKLPVMKIFQNLTEATTNELIDIIQIAAQKADKDANIKSEILDTYDYMDLFSVVQDVVIKIMFAGTAEQNEEKLSKMKISEQQKNAIRELLGIPIVPLIGETSSEKDLE